MKDEQFKPYIPADKITPEFTVTSVIMGMLLAVVFGAANAYLGLRVGMTVSASIPAAVISMGVIRVIMKKDSILESNMVQTIGSAGESLAAGAIFTLPVLFLWAKDGIMDSPSLLTIMLISLCGGILGVLFMVHLEMHLSLKNTEHFLIQKEQLVLKYYLLVKKVEQVPSLYLQVWDLQHYLSSLLMELRLFLVLLQHLLSRLRQNFQQKYIRHYLV